MILNDSELNTFLPEIDKMARSQNSSRADVIRKILYEYFDYQATEPSTLQERNKERKIEINMQRKAQNAYIPVFLEGEFQQRYLGTNPYTREVYAAKKVCEFLQYGAPLKTLGGEIFKHTFDPKLIAGFDEIWNSTFHKTWEPIYKEDLKLINSYDFFKTIVNRVKRYNESYDMTVVGDRGLGKSAFGLAAAQIMHRIFTEDPEDEFPLDRVCFDVDAWIETTSTIHGGGVVILDEVGTEGSLSSRTSMSKGNRATSDIIQLMRTDRIITIYISTDRDRIDKRVRQLTSVMGTPIRKLTNEDTNGYGLGIEADIKYKRTHPATNTGNAETDSGYLHHEITKLKFSAKGVIHSVVVPHPDIPSWREYEAKRARKLSDVREAGLLAQDVDVKEEDL